MEKLRGYGEDRGEAGAATWDERPGSFVGGEDGCAGED